MSEHHAKIAWSKTNATFSYKEYQREHEWTFPNGTSVAASAAPDFFGREDHVDPEEAFVASLSACHMLTFLAICCKKKLVVESYVDEPVGFLEANDAKQLVMKRVLLRPKITFAAGQEPKAEQLTRLHKQSHKHCFLANSVNTEITVQ